MKLCVRWMISVMLLAASEAPALAQREGTVPRRTAERLQFDIGRFSELPNLSPEERARQGIAFLREEVANPSRSLTSGDGTGVIDHDSILATMAALLAEHKPDSSTLRAEYSRTAPGEVKDSLAVVLGLLGERAVLPHLAAFFGNVTGPPCLRVAAAGALARMPDRRVVPYAAQVLGRDPATRVTYRHNKYTLATEAQVQQFFVRGAALGLLQAIKAEGIDLGSEVSGLMKNGVVEVVVPLKPMKAR